ncbi:DUF2807 domain-containing protein [Candidatus Kaiserbacteria bacterium]|nr:DUF2807 domain-containing protein [Candidatus Kaiserbacteria bacterium]
MKKALQISIAQTLFTVEEDAYAALDAYLTAVKRHFDSNAAKDEIVSDIETRIAEQLHESKENVITFATVTRVTAQMGGIEDFGDDEPAVVASGSEKKKLYRDADNRIIAGVCSGLAAYFGLETLWVRLGFAALTLFNGVGILIYVVLWIVLPEAKTASQKLQMTGTPVTLETLSETVNERIVELRSNRSRNFGRALSAPFRVLGRCIRVLIGAAFVIGSGILVVAVLVASGFFMSGTTWIADEVSLSALLPGASYWIVLIGVTLVAVIPLLFILFAGVSLLVKRGVLYMQAGLMLLGVWFIALLVSGFGAATVISNYDRIVRTLPAYQVVSKTVPLDSFAAIDIGSGADVRIVATSSTAATLTASGRAQYLDSFDAHVEDGVLTLALKPVTHSSCLFCTTSRPALTLEVPARSIESVRVRYGGSLRADALPATPKLSVSAENGAYIDVALDIDSLTASASHGSRLGLRGVTKSADVSVSDGSYADAADLKISDAIVSATRGSRADVQATKTLKATAQSGSSIRYSGDAVLDENASGGGDISSY